MYRERLTCSPDHGSGPSKETPGNLLECSEFDPHTVKGRVELRVRVSCASYLDGVHTYEEIAKRNKNDQRKWIEVRQHIVR